MRRRWPTGECCALEGVGIKPIILMHCKGRVKNMLMLDVAAEIVTTDI